VQYGNTNSFLSGEVNHSENLQLTPRACNPTVIESRIATVTQGRPTVNGQLFQKNRAQFPPEELAKYAGKYVAWSPEGSSILACHEDELQLAKAIEADGRNSAEILIAFVPAEDEVLLGGGMEVIECYFDSWGLSFN
jgi:hypothetical protein